MKWFNNDCWFQVYMYALIYVDSEIMAEEDYLLYTRIFFENNKKISIPVPELKHLIGFSYIHPEDYELNLNFYKNEVKIKSY